MSPSPTRSISVERDPSDKKSQMVVSCRVESDYLGEIYSDSSTRPITVYWGPVRRYLEPKLERVEIDEGELFTLSCSFDGFPAPRLSWVQFNDRVGVEKSAASAYAIPAASGQDTGTWQCTATNPVTGISKKRSVELIVRQKPKIISEKLQKKPDTEEADKMLIKCKFTYSFGSGESFSRLSWSKIASDETKKAIIPGRLSPFADRQTIYFIAP